MIAALLPRCVCAFLLSKHDPVLDPWTIPLLPASGVPRQHGLRVRPALQATRTLETEMCMSDVGGASFATAVPGQLEIAFGLGNGAKLA